MAAALAEGQLLTPREQSHVDACLSCRGEVEDLTQLFEDLSAGAPELPSTGATQRCIELFAASHPASPALLERVARWVFPPPSFAGAAVGLRGNAAVAERRLYEVDGVTVDLELAPTADTVQLTGLVVLEPGESPPLLAWAEQDGLALTETPVTDDGLFRLELACALPVDVVLEFERSRVRLRLGP